MANPSRRRLNTALLSAAGLAAAAPLWTPSTVLAQGARFDEGIDYLALPPVAGRKPTPTAKGSPVEVLEFFWFSCPFCWRLEPRLKEWKAQLDPKQVDFKQVHVGFADDGQQRLFATIQSLGLTASLSPKIFDAIHVQKKAIRSSADALRFLEQESGLPKDQVKAAWNSPAVEATLRESADQVSRFAVQTVPSFVVGGRFMANPQLASGNNARLIQIVNYLVALSRAA